MISPKKSLGIGHYAKNTDVSGAIHVQILVATSRPSLAHMIFCLISAKFPFKEQTRVGG
jgi:hypothetical protein